MLLLDVDELRRRLEAALKANEVRELLVETDARDRRRAARARAAETFSSIGRRFLGAARLLADTRLQRPEVVAEGRAAERRESVCCCDRRQARARWCCPRGSCRCAAAIPRGSVSATRRSAAPVPREEGACRRAVEVAAGGDRSARRSRASRSDVASRSRLAASPASVLVAEPEQGADRAADVARELDDAAVACARCRSARAGCRRARG